ncbi:MAG: winged helix-turn-helix transcriptional regulator [Candidatus Heimdallarchaeaceae archaeon]
MINTQEYNLLILLQSQPTISYAEIAKHLKISPATAKRRVDYLKKKGLYSGKYALYSPSALGLTKFIVLAFVEKTKNLSILEKALKEHPYTHHRSRIYSPKLGVYSEFHFPSTDSSLLCRFFDLLIENNIVKEYSLFTSTNVEKNLPLDLSKISLENFYWEFNWDLLRKKIGKIKLALPSKTKKSVLPLMKPIDFRILRILTYDADVSQREICRQLNVSRTEVWRRIHFLESNVITGYKAKINRKFFNVVSNKLIFLAFKDEKELKKLFSLLSNDKIRPPFRYRIEVITKQDNENILLLYISLPHYHEAQLFYFLNDYTTISNYDIDPVRKHGVRYSFYDLNYDSQNKEWILTEDYVVDNPISNTLSSKQEILSE